MGNPWKQRQLKDYASFSKGRGYSKSDISDSGVPLLLYGSLYTDYKPGIRKVNVYAHPQPNSVFSTGREVVIPASGETAEEIARASALLHKGVLIGGDLNIILPKEDIDSEFLALEISNGAIQKQLASKAQGKSVVHLHNADFKNIDIFLPEISEQILIRGFLGEIEKDITLHQRNKWRFNYYKS